MITLKNKDLSSVSSALLSLGNHQSDIAYRWELAKYAKKIDDAYSLLNVQIKSLVKEKGKKDDEGNISLDTNNSDYLKLMDLDIDIDVEKKTIDELNKFNPTMQELMNLSPIIKEGD